MRQPDGEQKRLAAILSALEDMAAGVLDRRAPVSSARDEIDAIAYTINVLVGELHFTVDRLGKAERESHRANQQKSLFLRNVSHELRTPLAAMLSFANLLGKTTLAEEQRVSLDRIVRNGQALGYLIDDLLDLARIEAGKLHVTREQVSPAEVSADVVQSLLPTARAKHLQLILTLNTDLPTQIVTDARRLRQILMNVVGNAVKFTDSGAVIVGVSSDSERLIVDVTDTGPGISDHDKQRLFSTFMQSDEAGSHERGGVGLGLVLAKQLSRHLSGDLELVRSKLGEGSQFRLSIELHTTPAPPAAAPAKAAGRELDGLRVLFAEDNHDILSSYSQLLEIEGCTVDQVTNGLEVINRATAGGVFDVVLMDMQMPILDGLEATRRLRTLGFKSPILALSAHAMTEDRQRFLDAGCDDHISKPIDIESLIVRLKAYRGSAS